MQPIHPSLLIRRVVVPGLAALAMAMGVGRFGFTPILPMMQDQAGLPPAQGAHLATANYVGYLLGATLALIRPALAATPVAYRTWLVLQVASLAVMPLTTSGALWMTGRVVSGAASALIFVSVAGSLATHLLHRSERASGWAYGGIGAGIALSGVLVLVADSAGTWVTAWWACTVAAAILAVIAWPLGSTLHPDNEPARPAQPAGHGAHAGHAGEASHGTHEDDDVAPAVRPSGHQGAGNQDAGTREAVVGSAAGHPSTGQSANQPAARRAFVALVISYFLEGAGYIIAGTFLVAAIRATAPEWIGTSAWVLVGLAAVPSSALYARLAQSSSPATVLRVALLFQAAGMVLPAVFSESGPALLAGVVFGATFQGITTLTVSTGARMGVPRSAAALTIAFSVGQILGPVAAAPLLQGGYGPALILGAVLAAAAALPLWALNRSRPHHCPSHRIDNDSGTPHTGGTT